MKYISLWVCGLFDRAIMWPCLNYFDSWHLSETLAGVGDVASIMTASLARVCCEHLNIHAGEVILVRFGSRGNCVTQRCLSLWHGHTSKVWNHRSTGQLDGSRYDWGCNETQLQKHTAQCEWVAWRVGGSSACFVLAPIRLPRECKLTSLVNIHGCVPLDAGQKIS